MWPDSIIDSTPVGEAGESAPLVPRTDRFDPSSHGYGEILAAHRRAVEAGESLYRDPITGLWVFTSATLAERGWCCERGCRHCPYPARTDGAREGDV